jgi:hypothetical protein
MRWIRAIGKKGAKWVRPAVLTSVGIRYGQGDNRCDVIGTTKKDTMILLSTYDESKAHKFIESL